MQERRVIHAQESDRTLAHHGRRGGAGIDEPDLAEPAPRTSRAHVHDAVAGFVPDHQLASDDQHEVRAGAPVDEHGLSVGEIDGFEVGVQKGGAVGADRFCQERELVRWSRRRQFRWGPSGRVRRRRSRSTRDSG
jgi:hypothetical protein